MRTLLPLLACLFVIACSVKPRDTGVTPVSGHQLIDGVYLSQNKKFLMRPSTVDLIPHEENTVTYTILDSELRPLDSSYAFEAESDMPTMQMGGPWKAERLVVESDGRVSATYNIWHGHPTHLWQFTIRILREGKEIDRFIYSHLVRVE